MHKDVQTAGIDSSVQFILFAFINYNYNSYSVCNYSITVIYVELLDGFGFANQGRVSLYYNGQWGSVCDDEWDINDAHVVCRMLGYPRALTFTANSTFGGAQDGPIWLDEVNCTGNENTLAACPHFGWGNSDCDHTGDAGVICDFNYTVAAKGKVMQFNSLAIENLRVKKSIQDKFFKNGLINLLEKGISRYAVFSACTKIVFSVI